MLVRSMYYVFNAVEHAWTDLERGFAVLAYLMMVHHPPCSPCGKHRLSSSTMALITSGLVKCWPT